MLVDLIIGVVASLIASAVVGFLGHRAISEQDNTVLRVYVLFLSIAVFIVSAMLSVILNKDFLDKISKMSEVNVLKFYTNCIHSFELILFIVTLFSGGVLLAEIFRGNAKQNHNDIK